MKGKSILLILAMVFLFLCQPAFAQQKTISGTVLDENSQPMPGAAVLLKGNSAIGSITDLDGKYSIQVPANAVLEFSSIGYVTKEVAVGNSNVINVTMEMDKLALEETVVVGYGTHKKETLTGSVVSVKGSEVVKSPAPTLGSSLAGRLPGLIVNQRSGEPGRDDPSIYIRGASTFGSTTPLIIIDGVERDNMNRLNPEDIESISVLKDASAAIYGARAANGVILITTKTGEVGKTDFSVDYNASFSRPTIIPEMLSAADFATVYNEADWYRKGRPTTNYTPAFSPEEIEKYRSGVDPVLYPNTNWVKEIMLPFALQQRAGIQASGGTESVRYLLSLSALTQGTGYRNSLDHNEQYTFRSKIDIRLSQNFSFGVNISAILQNQIHNAVTTHDHFVNILQADPRLVCTYPNGYIAPGRLGENPLTLDQRGYDKSQSTPVYTTFTATYNIPWVKGLRLDGSFNYDIKNSKSKNYKIPYYYYEYNVLTGEYDYKMGTGQKIVELRDTYSNGSTMLANLRITYDRNFEDHHVAAMLGTERQVVHSSDANAYRKNFISTSIDEINVGSTAAEDKDNGGTSSSSARLNYFGRFNYEFASKYLVELIARYDGSYKFPQGRRYGFFPAMSLGWRISQEPFIRDNAPWIDQLKIRTSIGQTGNDNVSAYQFLQSYSFGGNYVFGSSSSSGIQPDTMPNPNITWEKSTKYDLGLETGFWNGLLGAEFTFFHEKRRDILTSRSLSIPSTFGFSSLPDENIGKVNNSGYEIVLNHRNKVGDFNYNLSANMSYAKSKIIYMDETPNVEEYQNRTGRPLGASLYYKADGIFHSQAELDAYPHHKNTQVGDIRIVDLNNDGVIDSNDQFRFGYTATPRYVFGFTGNFSYKNFDLMVFFQGQTGAYTYDSSFVLLGPSDFSNTYVARAKNRWTVDNPNGTMPRADGYQPGSSTFYLFDATFVRLKNLEFGYSLPKAWTNALTLKSARIYLSGSNLLTWAKEIKWADPEATGASANYYPQQKMINLGVKVGF